jgi:hypothetical protein
MVIRSNSCQVKCILFIIANNLTNSMKQSPSSEINSCSVSQEISLILQKLNFPFNVFTTAYHNSAYTHVSHFFRIQFNIALISMPTHTHTHTYSTTHSLIHLLTNTKHTQSMIISEAHV